MRQKINKQKLPNLGQRVFNADDPPPAGHAASLRCIFNWATVFGFPGDMFKEVLDLVTSSKLPDPTEPLPHGYWKGELAAWEKRCNSPPPPSSGLPRSKAAGGQFQPRRVSWRALNPTVPGHEHIPEEGGADRSCDQGHSLQPHLWSCWPLRRRWQTGPGQNWGVLLWPPPRGWVRQTDVLDKLGPEVFLGWPSSGECPVEEEAGASPLKHMGCCTRGLGEDGGPREGRAGACQQGRSQEEGS